MLNEESKKWQDEKEVLRHEEQERGSHGPQINILKERKQRHLFEYITAEHLPGLMEEPMHKLKSPINFKLKKSTPRHIIMKVQTQKHEENIRHLKSHHPIKKKISPHTDTPC